MSRDKTDRETGPDLLGYHLGLLDEAERAEVESAFASPEALREALRRLTVALAPLDADAVDAPPPDLSQRILDRVAAEPQTLPFPNVQTSMPEQVGGAEGNGMKLAMRELIGLAAAILVFVGIFVPGYQSARSAAEKVACSNNLRIIGTGHEQYATDNAGAYPFAGVASPDKRWAHVESASPNDSPRYASIQKLGNSRHAYRLVQGGYVPVDAFYCPSHEGDEPFAGPHPEAYGDFPFVNNNSYATNLVTGSPWRKQSLDNNAPLAADMTPLVNPRRLIIIRGRVPLNSPSHARLGGQNILRAGGSVAFAQSPRLGDDDIYRIRGIDVYDGDERPASSTDAFLVP